MLQKKVLEKRKELSKLEFTEEGFKKFLAKDSIEVLLLEETQAIVYNEEQDLQYLIKITNKNGKIKFRYESEV
jgi:hypothetical protein